jgi:hypothetical protein
MEVGSWVQKFRDDLLATEATLRPLVRRVHHDPPPRGERLTTWQGRMGCGITIGADEARTLLRAAMPVPVASRHKREPHAELVAALASFAAGLLDLNDPTAGPRTMAGACDLIEALRAWVARMRWHEATAAAGVRWGVDPSAPAFPNAHYPATDPADVPNLFDLPRSAMQPGPAGGRRNGADVPVVTDGKPLIAALKSAKRRAAREAADGQLSLFLPLPGRTAESGRNTGTGRTPVLVPPAGAETGGAAAPDARLDMPAAVARQPRALKGIG